MPPSPSALDAKEGRCSNPALPAWGRGPEHASYQPASSPPEACGRRDACTRGCGRRHLHLASDAPVELVEAPHAHVLLDDVGTRELPLGGVVARVDVQLDLVEIVEHVRLAAEHHR